MILGENGEKIYIDENGNPIQNGEGLGIDIPGQESTGQETPTPQPPAYVYPTPEGWPELPAGQHYVIDPKNGEVVIDLMTGQPLIEYDN